MELLEGAVAGLKRRMAHNETLRKADHTRLLQARALAPWLICNNWHAAHGSFCELGREAIASTLLSQAPPQTPPSYRSST